MTTKSSEASFWVDDEYELLTEVREWMDVPEKRLLYAIVERAVRDCLGSRDEDSQEATEWLFCDGNTRETIPFSFPWICENLELDQSEFRSRVLRTADRLNYDLAERNDCVARVKRLSKCGCMAA